MNEPPVMADNACCTRRLHCAAWAGFECIWATMVPFRSWLSDNPVYAKASVTSLAATYLAYPQNSSLRGGHQHAWPTPLNCRRRFSFLCDEDAAANTRSTGQAPFIWAFHTTPQN